MDLVVIIQIVYYGRLNRDLPEENASNKSENEGEKKTAAETDEKVSAEDKNKATGEYNELEEDIGS